MNPKALYSLSYGLYIIGTKDGGRDVGCVVNTVTQSTSTPATLTVCVNNDNFTADCIKAANRFSVSILSESANPELFGIFGFSSSRESDKFAKVPHKRTPGDLPYVSEGAAAFLECKVLKSITNFTHTIFVAEVVQAEVLSPDPPMTYAYYHSVVKGKTPPKASSYIVEEKHEGTYTCLVCGYEYPGTAAEFEAEPEDYTCPICGVDKSKFKLK